MISNLFHRIRGSYKHKAMVLMYHRIATLQTDPWQLAVTPENFARQLQVLKQQYHVISVNELVRDVHNNSIKSKTVCITFDDAYVDNYLYAKPLLEKYGCPAMFFVPSAYIGVSKPFWWDELEDIILHSDHLPASISLLIGSESFEFTDNDAILTEDLKTKQKLWRWFDDAPTKRCELYLALWKRLRPLPVNEIMALLQQVKTWANYGTPVGTDNLPMTVLQLKEMCNHPLLDIGIHTATHPALASHSKEVQQHEIATCMLYLEKISGRKIATIAYPYGNYNEDTLAVVKEQNLSAAFTTNARVIDKSSDPFLLGRFTVTDQASQQFKKKLSTWINQI
jgi:peptidoglycan/xylan/chitin deacetylase (PgdA/CDA1 family)